MGARTITLELTDGTTVQTYDCPLYPLANQYAPLRLVVGWCYEPTPAVFISAQTAGGTELGTIAPPDQITVYELSDTLGRYQRSDSTLTTDPDLDWLHDGLASNAMFTHVPVFYPASVWPMPWSIRQGVEATIAAISATPGPFILVGTGQGAVVVSDVYDQIRSGSLWSRRSDFLAGITFGNPRRPRGHTFPGCPDPGGWGVHDELLLNPEPHWWEFAIPGDPLSCVGTLPWAGTNNEWITTSWRRMRDDRWDGTLGRLIALIFDPPMDIIRIASTLLNRWQNIDCHPFNAWGLYDPINQGLSQITGGGSCYATALSYILSFAARPTTSTGVYLPAPTLPTRMTLDGQVGFGHFHGLFTAHVIKLEPWGLGQASFQANPSVYTSPDPVVPDATGNLPATTLDNAIYAAAWATQEHGTGGCHATNFEEKTWTPIWRDYIVQKGKLYFPQQISMKYLKMEFTNLTQESYPVYDSGIQVRYQVFPIGVIQACQARAPRKQSPHGLLTLGNDVVLRGLGSVNWLNPSTVNKAVNSVYGQTVTPISVLAGIGYNTSVLPNTVTQDLFAQTRQEVSSPWVYRRNPINGATLAAQIINVSTSVDMIQSGGTMTQAGAFTAVSGNGYTSAFTPLLNHAATPTTLPQIGSDWWVFPGGTLRLPATVMNGLTGLTDVVTFRGLTTEFRLRFMTACVHRYEVRTVTRDAAVAYFAGVREVQPYVTTYIDYQDPDVFEFSQYDPTQWVCTNIRALDSGPITTTGTSYQIVDPNFDIGIYDWIQTQGVWEWNNTTGHWEYGVARVIADGTEKELVSSPMDIVPGVHINASVWVDWNGLVATADTQAIELRALYYNGPTFITSQSVGLTYNPWPTDTPVVAGNHWAQIVANLDDETGFTVPPETTVMRLALAVTSEVSAGTINFDTVEVFTPDHVEGTIYKDFLTTSTFTKLTCTFTDTGLVRSDDMWAQADPNDTNISSTALAYYTTTIPDAIPAGMWGDTFAEWADPTIVWGEPRAMVAIQVDPDRTFQGKRVLHFSRDEGAGECGVKVRQTTHFVANCLFRIGCVFYKPDANTNQVIIRLRRLSDGLYIYEETFDPVSGFWYEYTSSFAETPDSEDQQYTVELVCTGDQADDFYLNDLWVDIAQIRYFVRLGGEGAFLHDVTPLRYAGLATVSCTDPVSEFSVQAAILSPHSYCYGASFAPTYLK